MIFSLLIPVIVSATKSPDCLVLRVILYTSKTALRTTLVERRVMCLGGAQSKEFQTPVLPEHFNHTGRNVTCCLCCLCLRDVLCRILSNHRVKTQ